MNTLLNIIKILAYAVFTLFLIGLISRLGENYGRVAVLVSLIFWTSFYYLKYKRMERMIKSNPASSTISPDIPLVATAPIPEVVEINQINIATPSHEITQEKSVWVTVMGVINILLPIISSKYILVLLIASIAMAAGGSSLSYYFFKLFPLLFLVYFITTIIAVSRSFSKNNPILSVKDSHYLLFWPLIQLVIILGFFIVAIFNPGL